jgi:mRNA-degrading endonuclease RelE of RelBE toxin-antitoxin system
MGRAGHSDAVAGLRAVRRGACRIVYEIREEESTVDRLRIDHRPTVYRDR